MEANRVTVNNSAYSSSFSLPLLSTFVETINKHAMIFFDKKERNLEEYGYQVYTQRDLEDISKKKKVDRDYKKSLELVRECIQTPKAYVYRFKLKDLDIDEIFYTSEFEYVCRRVE